MGRSLMEMCKLLSCLPSELYKKYDPTIGDFMAVSTYANILREEENDRIKAILDSFKR